MSWYTLLGTSHIAQDTTKKIKHQLATFAPDTVAIELDATRLHALIRQEKPSYSLSLIRQVGVKGYLFALLGGWLQRKLGRVVNVTPGSDMLAAVRLAGKEKKELLLIDRHIQVTLRRLNHAMGWPEFRQFLKDLWESLFHKERVSINLAKTPGEDVVVQLLSLFEERYPRPYKVLLSERNRYMVRALLKFHEQYPEKKVLVVIGAGHKAGMEALLQQQPI